MKRHKFQQKSWNFVKNRNIFNPEQNVSQLDLVCAIFCTHQTGDTCAGVCMCNRMHQMEKTAMVEPFCKNS